MDFDLQDTDVYWCTADVGWITGHDRLWPSFQQARRTIPVLLRRDMIEKYGVTVFYRSNSDSGVYQMGEHLPLAACLRCDCWEPWVSRLTEAWIWYHHVIGVIAVHWDTWWQTETGGIMITATWCHGNGSATQPFPGIADVVDLEAAVADNDGYLAIRHLGLG